MSSIICGEFQWARIAIPQHFHEELHRRIFEAILDLIKKDKDPDFLNVCDAMSDDKEFQQIGGSAFLAEMMANLPSLSMVASAMRILQEKYSKRSIIAAGKKMVEIGEDTKHDVRKLPQLMSDAAKRMADIIPRDIEIDKEELIEEIERDDDKIPTGFSQLDMILEGGLEPGWLFLIAARPSVGKSSMASTIMANFLKNDIPTSIISLEMSRKQIMRRLLCCYFHVTPAEAKEHARSYIERLHTPFYINVNGSDISMVIQEIFTTPAKVVIIDYYGLITVGSKEGRIQQLEEISRSIKGAAMQSGKAVIMLAQLNRDIEKEKGARQPRLSDLYGAGEKDADQISFLHDPNAREDISPDPMEISASVDANPVAEIEWIIRKNRHGPTGYLKLKFEKKKFLMSEEFPSSPKKLPTTPHVSRSPDSIF